MFSRNRNIKALSDETVFSQPPGKIFRWTKGTKITAIDMVIIAVPKALLSSGGETISSVIEADDEMNVAIPPDSDKIFLYVQPGMSVTLKKSSESYIVANDDTPRRIRMTKPKA